MWYTQFVNSGKSVKSKHAKTLRLMATISVRMKKIPNYHDAVRTGGQTVKGLLGKVHGTSEMATISISYSKEFVGSNKLVCIYLHVIRKVVDIRNETIFRQNVSFGQLLSLQKLFY